MRNAQYSFASWPQLLHSYGLLDSSILLSHCTGASKDDAQLIVAADAHVASTPSTEIQMAMAKGVSLCLDETMRGTGIDSQCSLGVDCHSNNANSIPAEMRLVLQTARGRRNEKLLSQNKAPRQLDVKVQDVFNLGTIQGARAIGMDDKIGSIMIGKKADLVIFSSTSPAMICAAQFEPVAAVVMHSSPSDIEAVLVDGTFRKECGKLVSVELEGQEKNVSWEAVGQELMKSWSGVRTRVGQVDMNDARAGVISAFQIDNNLLVDL